MYDILRVSITLCAIQLVLSIVRKYQIEESTKKYSKFIKVEVGGEDWDLFFKTTQNSSTLQPWESPRQQGGTVVRTTPSAILVSAQAFRSSLFLGISASTRCSQAGLPGHSTQSVSFFPQRTTPLKASSKVRPFLISHYHISNLLITCGTWSYNPPVVFMSS